MVTTHISGAVKCVTLTSLRTVFFSFNEYNLILNSSLAAKATDIMHEKCLSMFCTIQLLVCQKPHLNESATWSKSCCTEDYVEVYSSLQWQRYTVNMSSALDHLAMLI